MKDIELQAEREAFEAWYEAYCMPSEADWFRRDVDDESEYHHAITADAWAAWQARAAIEADRAQRVPDGFRMVSVEMLTRWRDAFAEELGAWDIDPPIHHVQVGFDETNALLASTPAPAQQEPTEDAVKRDRERIKAGIMALTMTAESCRGDAGVDTARKALALRIVTLIDGHGDLVLNEAGKKLADQLSGEAG